MHKKNNGKMFIKRQCDRQEQAAKRPRGNARPVNLQRRKLRGKHSFALGLLISASLPLATITAAPRKIQAEAVQAVFAGYFRFAVASRQ